MAVVIAVPGNEDQAAQLATRLGAEVVSAEVRRFPDGELYVRSQFDHMAIVTSGKVIPLLLRLTALKAL
jgi:ribose-phosphate pyrophosphokinase